MLGAGYSSSVHGNSGFGGQNAVFEGVCPRNGVFSWTGMHKEIPRLATLARNDNITRTFDTQKRDTPERMSPYVFGNEISRLTAFARNRRSR